MEYKTIDLNKSREFFDPSTVKEPIHIVGCGAIGSHVAECLARLGVTNIHLWDDDVVNTHNIANQMFFACDVKKPKVSAVATMMCAINPSIVVTEHNERVKEDARLKGYVFLCVDSIVPRQQITNTNMYNNKCKAIFDFRMGLLSGQFYCADTAARMKTLLKTMNFTDEEADVNTPKSACNFELSVVYSIKALIGVGMNEVVKCWKGEPTALTTLINLDTVPDCITQM